MREREHDAATRRPSVDLDVESEKLENGTEPNEVSASEAVINR